MTKIEQQRFKLELDESINLKDFKLPKSGPQEMVPLSDIIEDNVDERYYSDNRVIEDLSLGCVGGKFTTSKTSRETGKFLNTEKSSPKKLGLYAYSCSTRKEHIDHRARVNEFANTLSTGEGCRNQSTQNFIVDSTGIRILTPLECERFHSYPDNHTKYGTTDQGTYELSDKERWKLLGNGVTSNVSQTLLEAFLPSGVVRVGSTFSGCGGTELRLPTRFEVLFHSDNNKYASDVLKYHYPDIPNYEDIRELDSSKLPEIDLLLGGFPCQAFSIAGKRAGFDDARGTLFYELARILKDRKVKNFMFENVKGLLSHDKGNTFKKILEVFSELGYSIDYGVYNSKDFGVPQSRERVFIFGRLDG